MRMVAPRIGHPEVTVAEEQEEYFPITVAFVDFTDGTRDIVTRWTLTPDERRAIAAGEDVYVMQRNFGGPMTPMNVYCGPGPYGPTPQSPA